MTTILLIVFSTFLASAGVVVKRRIPPASLKSPIAEPIFSGTAGVTESSLGVSSSY